MVDQFLIWNLLSVRLVSRFQKRTCSVLHLCISESASEQEHREHQDFLFPDSQEITSNINTEPSCSNGEPFCETLDTYPYRHLKNVLRHSPGLDIFFGQDETPPDFNNRVADAADEKFVCEARSQVIFPQGGKNSKNKWKYIINQKDDDDGYVQGVRIEKCVRSVMKTTLSFVWKLCL